VKNTALKAYVFHIILHFAPVDGEFIKTKKWGLDAPKVFFTKIFELYVKMLKILHSKIVVNYN